MMAHSLLCNRLHLFEPPLALFFCLRRYRMVAKDFTLQQSMLPLTRIWVECHERMARWFILMDHKMQAAGELHVEYDDLSVFDVVET